MPYLLCRDKLICALLESGQTMQFLVGHVLFILQILVEGKSHRRLIFQKHVSGPLKFKFCYTLALTKSDMFAKN